MVEILKNYNIKKHTTFKIGGNLDVAYFPETTDELITLLKSNDYDIVLGNCSNVLFSTEDIHKKIIFTEKLDKYEIIENKIKVSAGTKGAVISNECKKRGLTGFEFLIGFPGSFGGMIHMNASAHNQAISDCFVCATLYNPKTKEICKYNKEQMQFEYRNSVVQKNNLIVIDAEFELKSGDIEQIEEIMKRNLEFRKTRQPALTYPNAGSTFKNPENDSAGRLLDLCNVKGKECGGACVFEKHANFVINKNNATSMDVIKLMYEMFLAVQDKYRIKLQPEIKYIGNTETEEYRLWQIMTENIH